MESSIVTPGILYIWLMQRKQQRTLQHAGESPPNGSATTASGLAGTFPSTSPGSDSPAASATSEEGNPPSPDDSLTCELRAPGTSTTDSTRIDTPTIVTHSRAASPRSIYRRGHGGR